MEAVRFTGIKFRILIKIVRLENNDITLVTDDADVKVFAKTKLNIKSIKTNRLSRKVYHGSSDAE